MRLQKYLSQAGIASRRQCEEHIRQGRVCINGEPATLGACVNPEMDSVTLNNLPVKRTFERVVILFNKPSGVICTNSDPQGRKTIREYFSDIPYRLYSAGRLDFNSQGLLIVTNDGTLTLKLTHPRYGIPKTYNVICDGALTSSQAANLRRGLELSDGVTLPARVENVRKAEPFGTSFSITIYEGRNRQVRRMLEALGHKTLYLSREKIGRLSLKGLAAGEWRYAASEELAWLDSLPNDKE